jgi:hypothetical protein
MSHVDALVPLRLRDASEKAQAARTCGFVPCTSRARTSVRFAMATRAASKRADEAPVEVCVCCSPGSCGAGWN